jgi:hypothetical protein
MPIKAPFYSYQQIVDAAHNCGLKFNPHGIVPVPIEEIIDLGFRIDIVPEYGMEDRFQAVAFITRDLKEIRVDRRVYEYQPGRLRFSLAHELAHLVLHADTYRQLNFHTTAEWKAAMTGIPEKEYSFLEYHANTFAGLLLVPPQPLRLRFDAVIEQIRQVGLDVRQMSDVVYDRLLGKLAQDFDVSRGTMERRIEKDQLWHP